MEKCGQVRHDGLNLQQIKAVTHGDDPLLVVAGAGTGKTRILAARVDRLISQDVPPNRTLLVTFTRIAAEAMLSSAARAKSQDAVATRVWRGTFHSIANRLLRMYGQLAGSSGTDRGSKGETKAGPCHSCGTTG